MKYAYFAVLLVLTGIEIAGKSDSDVHKIGVTIVLFISALIISWNWDNI